MHGRAGDGKNHSALVAFSSHNHQNLEHSKHHSQLKKDALYTFEFRHNPRLLGLHETTSFPR